MNHRTKKNETAQRLASKLRKKMTVGDLVFGSWEANDPWTAVYGVKVRLPNGEVGTLFDTTDDAVFVTFSGGADWMPQVEAAKLEVVE